MTNIFKRKITKDQSRDTGMAMVLLFLLVFLSRHKLGYVYIAIGLHVLNMIVPQIFKPVAVIWLGLSDVLAAVVPKILLAIVYFVVVTPIGILRRLSGKDALKLRAFHGGQDSAMVERNHLFIGRDLEKPY